jgi:hypothetical protein
MAYTLTHPESDHTVKVEKEQAGMYLSQGWQTKPGVKVPAEVAETAVEQS